MTFKQTYRPFFLEYALLAEFNLVRRQHPVGVFVIPSSASALIWFGIIFVRQVSSRQTQGTVIGFALSNSITK